MLDLLCCREMPPAGRKVGNARHVWESENAAVVSANAEFTLSFEQGACHARTHVAADQRRGKRADSRVRAV